MITKKQKWQEIANRGLQDKLDPQTRARFDEAVKRGLIVLPGKPQEKGMLEKGINAITPLPIGKMIDAYSTPEQKAGVTEMMNNVPSSAMNLAKGVYNTVAHPIDTAKGMQSLGQGIFEKAFIPNEINGIDFGETENTQLANQVGNSIKDRYWGLDNIKNTAKTDPAGMLLDLSVIPTAGQTAGAGIMKAASKAVPESMPAKMMEDALVMRPTINKYNPNNKREIVETILKEQVDPTSSKGSDKSYENINNLNAQVEGILDNVPQVTVIQQSELLKDVQSVIDQFTGIKFKGKKNQQDIDKALSDWNEQLAKYGDRKEFTVREVQDFKKDLYKELESAFKKGDFSDAETELMRNIANSAKESLENVAPGIKEANARLSKNYQMMEELPTSINKMENYRGVGQDLANKTVAGTTFGAALLSPFGFGAASIGGALGAATGAASGILSHPRVRAKNALLLDRLRKSGSYTDELIRKNKLPLATQGLLYTGQL